jgi:uncharacterized protein YhaN
MAKEIKKSYQPAAAQGKSLSSPAIQEEIRKLAEDIYKKRGNKPGDSLADWVEAEKQIKRKYGI